MKRLGLVLSLGSALIFGNTAFAGPGSSGGGSYVTIDGETMIADPYFAGRPASQIKQITRATYQDLPEEVRNYMLQIRDFMYAVHLRTYKVDSFFEKYLASGRYYLVPKEREQNVPCERYLPILNRPVDAHFEFGCTFDGATYLFVDEWKKAPIAEQAFAILHERLWAANSSADQADIATFNGWLERFMRRQYQQLNGFDRTPLTKNEIASFDEFYQASSKLGFPSGVFRNAEWQDDRNYSIVSGGAFLYGDCRTSLKLENSFLSLGTELRDCGHAGPRVSNSAIINSYIQFNGHNLAIQDSTIISSTLGPVNVSKSEINKSTINWKLFYLQDRDDHDKNGYYIAPLNIYQPIDIVQSQIKSSDVGGNYEPNFVNEAILSSHIEGSTLYGYFLNSSAKKSAMLGHIENSTFNNSTAAGWIYYSDFVDSSLHINKFHFTDTQLSGTDVSRIRLMRSELGAYYSAAVQPGTLLEDVVIGASKSLKSEFGTVKLGKNTILRKLKIVPPEDASMVFWPGLTIYDDTQVENGTVNAQASNACQTLNGSEKTNFSIGKPNQTSMLDLQGREKTLMASWPGCSASL